MVYRNLVAAALLAVVSAAYGQWESLNPGGGGQVQDIVCDPGHAGRAYLLSDMEGLYRSDDAGETWKITSGDLVHNRVYALAVQPGNSNRLYVGTAYGLHTSDDAGASYQFVRASAGVSIAAIAVDPFDARRIIAAEGWTDDADEMSGVLSNMVPGPGRLFVSTDAGKTWEVRQLDPGATDDPNVWTVAFDRAHQGVVYLGSTRGVMRSGDHGATWTKVAPPMGMPHNRGVALSPDGEVLYAAFSDDKQHGASVQACSTGDMKWVALDGHGLPPGLQYWRPDVDVRSGRDEHRVLISLQHERAGLHEATIRWEGGRIASVEWKPVLAGTEGFDVGWDFGPPNPRFAHYTPAEWRRGIWTTGNQNAYSGTPSKSAWGYDWANRYCIPDETVTVAGRFHPYRWRGFASTFTYEAAVHENYAIQGDGDNGWVESWDGGRSWSNILRHQKELSVSDAQAVAVADAWGTPVILAQGSPGYGGMATEGNLFAKRLKTHSPEDVWEHIAGGKNWKGGLPNAVIRAIHVDPQRRGRFYVAVDGNGIYRNEDLGWYIDHINTDHQAGMEKITGGEADKASVIRSIATDPGDPNIVYFVGNSGQTGVYRGQQNADKSWSWRRIFQSEGWGSEIRAWERAGGTCLVHAGKWDDPGAGVSREDSRVTLSLDGGKTWRTVLDRAQVLSVRKPPAWFEPISGKYHFNATGLAGFDDQVFVAVYDHSFQKGYGVFRGTILADGTVKWRDWTGDLPFAGLTRASVYTVSGKRYLYAATAGMGLWRREIEP